MFARLVLTILPVVLVALPAVADDPLVPATPAARVEVRFPDDSLVKMALAETHLDVTTKFGKVRVPIHEIRSVEFATRIPSAVAARIEAAALRLGSEEAKEREAAAAELLALQELAYPTLVRLTKSKDIDVRKQAERMVAVLRDKLPEEKLIVRQHDTIVADAFTIVGMIDNVTLKGKSPYFDETTLRVADLRGLRRASGEGTLKDLVIEAAKHGAPGPVWFDTGVEVTRDGVLDIRASGEVDLYPIGAELGLYRTGPVGSRQWGNSRDQKVPGMLYGRIGEKGAEFEIGQRFNGPTPAAGKLYLRVGSSPWGVVTSGRYQVRIDLR